MTALITEQGRVTEIAAAIREAGRFVIDLEFVPEGYYVPELALVQVGWGSVETPEVAAIDPLEVDPRPVLRLVGEAEIETVLHAAQADLALLASSFGIEGRGVRDTQVAAAFFGLGDQIGYAPLVERLRGVRLDKGSQYTEWLRRPLSDAQLEYALDDVRHLPAVWAELRAGLVQNGRLSWVEQECEWLAEHADRRPPPDQAYLRVKGWRRLNGGGRGALRGLAAWREHEARRTNRPPSRILNDRSLLELARAQPAEAEQIAAVRGIDDGTVRRHGPAMLRAVATGTDDPPPREPENGARQPLADVWATVLSGIVQGYALELGIAPRFLSTRAELVELARWRLDGAEGEPESIPLLHGWRRELLGDVLLDWLGSGAALRAEPGAVTGLTLDPPSSAD